MSWSNSTADGFPPTAAFCLREIEGRLRVAERMAACIEDPRASNHVTHSMADIIRFRLLMIAAGYEDGNDADWLRSDPMFKMALDLTPSDRELCSQPTISRLENLPDARALLRMGRAMVDLYASPIPRFPSGSCWISTTRSMRFTAASSCAHSMRITMKWLSTHRRVRWRGPLHHRGIASRQAARRKGDQGLSAPLAARHSRQLAQDRDSRARRQPHAPPRFSTSVRQRARLYPRRRADLDAAPANRGPGSGDEDALRGRAEGRQGAPVQGVLRRGHELEPRRARHRPRRGRRARSGHALRRHQSATTQRPSALRGCLLPARSGRNHIKSWKTHLAADRTSCTKASANQLRLFLHAGAYWIMWGLRVSMPKRSMWRVAQFDTLRLRLIKIAARVVELKTMIRVHLPTSCPAQHIFHYALGQIPRLEIPASSGDGRGVTPQSANLSQSTHQQVQVATLVNHRRRRSASVRR